MNTSKDATQGIGLSLLEKEALFHGRTFRESTGNLIALCHIIEDFDLFDENLKSMVSPKHKDNGFLISQLKSFTKKTNVLSKPQDSYLLRGNYYWLHSSQKAQIKNMLSSGPKQKNDKKNQDTINENHKNVFILNLSKISKGQHVIFAHKARKFYKEKQDVIDVINCFSDTMGFVWDMVTSPYDKSMKFFAQYIYQNREKRSMIRAILQRLESLEIDIVEFNEKFDFTNKEFCLHSTEADNVSDIIYLDNMTVIPKYNKDIVYYQSTSSNYEIHFDPHCAKYRKSVKLNSLVFDAKRLPEKISIPDFIAKLTAVKEEKRAESIRVSETINFEKSVADLDRQISSVGDTITGLEDSQTKTELIRALLNMKKDLEQIKTFSQQCGASTLATPDETSQVIENEKTLHLKRREQ